MSETEALILGWTLLALMIGTLLALITRGKW